jgi:hypothetical protein
VLFAVNTVSSPRVEPEAYWAKLQPGLKQARPPEKTLISAIPAGAPSSSRTFRPTCCADAYPSKAPATLPSADTTIVIGVEEFAILLDKAQQTLSQAKCEAQGRVTETIFPKAAEFLINEMFLPGLLQHRHCPAKVKQAAARRYLKKQFDDHEVLRIIALVSILPWPL